MPDALEPNRGSNPALVPPAHPLLLLHPTPRGFPLPLQIVLFIPVLQLHSSVQRPARTAREREESAYAACIYPANLDALRKYRPNPNRPLATQGAVPHAWMLVITQHVLVRVFRPPRVSELRGGLHC